MNIAEFEKLVKPSAKRSRLEPFQSQIFELKTKGYADWQIRDWLEKNGVKVSRQAVQQFIKRRNAFTSKTSTAPIVSSAPLGQLKTDEASPLDELEALDKKQRREKLADKFIGDQSKPKNSIAARLIKQEKSK